MTASDPKITAIFKEMMEHCRLERRAKGNTTVRELAHKLGITENYLSSIENGREFPSIKIFLKYLLLNDFDLSPLKTLSIGTAQSTFSPRKSELINKIYSLDDAQVDFLAEQSKLAENFKVKNRKK